MIAAGEKDWRIARPAVELGLTAGAGALTWGALRSQGRAQNNLQRARDVFYDTAFDQYKAITEGISADGLDMSSHAYRATEAYQQFLDRLSGYIMQRMDPGSPPQSVLLEHSYIEWRRSVQNQIKLAIQDSRGYRNAELDILEIAPNAKFQEEFHDLVKRSSQLISRLQSIPYALRTGNYQPMRNLYEDLLDADNPEMEKLSADVSQKLTAMKWRNRLKWGGFVATLIFALDTLIVAGSKDGRGIERIFTR